MVLDWYLFTWDSLYIMVTIRVPLNPNWKVGGLSMERIERAKKKLELAGYGMSDDMVYYDDNGVPGIKRSSIARGRATMICGYFVSIGIILGLICIRIF